jgi:hypothetical protein
MGSMGAGKLPDDHPARVDRARLALRGTAVGFARASALTRARGGTPDTLLEVVPCAGREVRAPGERHGVPTV